MNIPFITPSVLSIISLFIAYYLGWLLTETKYRIAEKHWLLNRKPFSCRPCLTFHFGWILSALVAFFANSLPLFIAGAVASLLIWLMVELRSKYKIDE